jgi:HD-GYP domain-containing protein (c-di-GMP phosphodiesterase class II)
MVADRPYRTGIDPADAREELIRCAGTQFDPVVVDAFLIALETSEGELAAEPTLAEAA